MGGASNGNYGHVALDANGVLFTANVPRSITVATYSFGKILSAATTNATSLKASAGSLFGWHLVNTSAAWKYFRFYNLSSAPTVGTSTPVFNIPLPPGGGAVMPPQMAIGFATGIAYAITGAAADNDSTAVAANDVIGTLYYI